VPVTLSVAQTVVREAPPLSQVVLGPITFVAHCERHGIPYFGQAIVGYVPTSERLGASTLRRMVQRAARYGETAFPRELVAMLQVCIKPAGVALDIRTGHECAGPHLIDESQRRSAAWHGRYRGDARLRAEFLARCSALETRTPAA
jgi:GTP cyclohydrolase I